MKRLYIVICLFALSFAASAQSVDDALLISSNTYQGSARTMAMGNAFTAVGGDIGALTINPAASGIMRSSQISFSIGPSIANCNINGVKDSFSSLSVPSFGAIASFETNKRKGLFNFNYGVALNSRANFNSVTSLGTDTKDASYLSSLAASLAGIHYLDLSNEIDSYDPFYNNNVTWPEVLAWNTYVLATLPDSETDYYASTENLHGKDISVGGNLAQDYYRKRDGGIYDATFNIGGNINDELFFGANFNVAAVNLSVSESYAESARNAADFQDGFCRYAMQYSQETEGAGINGQFGIIFTPHALRGLRLGATYTTRTVYSLTDNWRYSAQSDFDNGHHYSLNSPMGVYDYKLYSPSRISLGAAYVIGSSALISVDYETVNYRDIRYEDINGSRFTFGDLNDKLSNQCNRSSVLRYGFEWWLYESFALRAGRNHYSAPAQWAQEKAVNSVGAGWRLGDAVTFDIAYQWMTTDSSFQMYNSYPGGNVPSFTANNRNQNLVFTINCKF